MFTGGMTFQIIDTTLMRPCSMVQDYRLSWETTCFNLQQNLSIWFISNEIKIKR